MAKTIRVDKKRPCLVCGGHKWPCSYRADKELAWCANVASDKPSAQGTWLHVLVARDNPVSDRRPRPVPAPKSVASSLLAPAEHLHLVYTALLDRRGLSESRLDRLLRRGLTRASINRNLYRDTPTPEESGALVRALEPLGLVGVPGFYPAGSGWRMVGCRPGYFVPYRDMEGCIVGLSYRLDVPEGKQKYKWLSSNPEYYRGGTKLTPPLHFARPELIPASRDILLTEGSLKAQVAAELLSLPVIGAGGVTQWGEGFAQRFRRDFPGKRAAVCYDSDWRTNPNVRRALESLMASLRDAGVPYVVRSWPQYDAKGIDDLALLLSQSNKEVRAA